MDYDADGRTDIVTGSYTGQLYLFRRGADETFAQREVLVGDDGATLLMPAYSVVPELVDMDADGDLDLVVGARSDPVQIVENVGTREAPVWSRRFRELKTAEGETITGSNAHHADWDGDGVRDLLVGSEVGGLQWYRNRGANDAPSYGPGEVLLANSSHERHPEGSTPERPGYRVKVHVTDWNGDGLADLLVGDVTWQVLPKKPLSETEAREKARLEQEGAELLDKLSGATERTERWALEDALEENRAALRAFTRSVTKSHGWVWLYLRADASGAERRSTPRD